MAHRARAAARDPRKHPARPLRRCRLGRGHLSGRHDLRHGTRARAARDAVAWSRRVPGGSSRGGAPRPGPRAARVRLRAPTRGTVARGPAHPAALVPRASGTAKGSRLVQRPYGRKNGFAPLQPDTPVVENSPVGRVLSADNEDARTKARLPEAAQPPNEAAVVHAGGKVKGEDPEQLTVGLIRRDELAPDRFVSNMSESIDPELTGRLEWQLLESIGFLMNHQRGAANDLPQASVRLSWSFVGDIHGGAHNGEPSLASDRIRSG